MNDDIDLIPPTYRLRMWQRGWLLRCALCLSLVLAIAFATGAYLRHDTDRAQARLDELQRQNSARTAAIRTSADLEQQKKTLAARLSLTSKSVGPLMPALADVDAALPDDGTLWFDRWEVSPPTQSFQQAGASDAHAGAMRIRGATKSLSTLSAFVSNLQTMERFTEANIVRTGANPGTRDIAFDLRIELGANEQ